LTVAMPAQGIDWADADPALQGVVTEAVRMMGTRQPRLTEEEARLQPHLHGAPSSQVAADGRVADVVQVSRRRQPPRNPTAPKVSTKPGAITGMDDHFCVCVRAVFGTTALLLVRRHDRSRWPPGKLPAPHPHLPAL
jgi:hypothetical protein